MYIGTLLKTRSFLKICCSDPQKMLSDPPKYHSFWRIRYVDIFEESEKHSPEVFSFVIGLLSFFLLDLLEIVNIKLKAIDKT